MKAETENLKALLKAGGHKYIKRLPHPSPKPGRKYIYFYNQEQIKKYKETGEIPGDEKGEKKSSVLGTIMKFFGFKRETEADAKVRAVNAELSDAGLHVGYTTTLEHMAEYFSNKAKWDARFSKKSGGAKSGAGSGEKKTGGGAKPEKKWNTNVMRFLYQKYGSGGGASDDQAKKEKELRELGIAEDVIEQRKEEDGDLDTLYDESMGVGEENADKMREDLKKDINGLLDKYESAEGKEKEKLAGQVKEKFGQLSKEDKEKLLDERKRSGEKGKPEEKKGDVDDSNDFGVDRLKENEKKLLLEITGDKDVKKVLEKWKAIDDGIFNDKELVVLNGIVYHKLDSNKRPLAGAVNYKKFKEEYPHFVSNDMLHKDSLIHGGVFVLTPKGEDVLKGRVRRLLTKFGKGKEKGIPQDEKLSKREEQLSRMVEKHEKGVDKETQKKTEEIAEGAGVDTGKVPDEPGTEYGHPSIEGTLVHGDADTVLKKRSNPKKALEPGVADLSDHFGIHMMNEALEKDGIYTNTKFMIIDDPKNVKDIYEKNREKFIDSRVKDIKKSVSKGDGEPLSDEEARELAIKNLEDEMNNAKKLPWQSAVPKEKDIPKKEAQIIGGYKTAQAKMWCSLLSDGENHAFVQNDYIAMFRKRYPGARFKVTSSKGAGKSPVVVEKDGKMVGVVMPILMGSNAGEARDHLLEQQKKRGLKKALGEPIEIFGIRV